MKADAGYVRNDNNDEKLPPEVLIIQQPDSSFGFATTKDYNEVHIEPIPSSDFESDNEQLEQYVRKHMLIYLSVSIYLFFSEGTTALLYLLYTDDYIMHVAKTDDFGHNMSIPTLKIFCYAVFVIYTLFLSSTFVLSMIGIKMRSSNVFDNLVSLAFSCSFIEIFLAPVGQFNVLTFVPRFMSVLYLKFLHLLLLRYELSQGLV